MNTEEKENHDKAWRLLEDAGIKLGNRMMIRSSFANMKSEENPFIKAHYKKGGGEVEYYSSTHDKIKSLMFKTENEVVLANAIFLNIMDVLFTHDEFLLILKSTFRLLRLESEWN